MPRRWIGEVWRIVLSFCVEESGSRGEWREKRCRFMREECLGEEEEGRLSERVSRAWSENEGVVMV